HTVPASARSRRTVTFEQPHIRAVLLTLDPSAKAVRIAARCSVVSLFMGVNVPTIKGRSRPNPLICPFFVGTLPPMPTPGRPRKPRATAKVEMLELRLTETEKSSFREAAHMAGIALSAWVRERLRRACIRE